MSLARATRGFDRLAPWYNRLVQLFFGNTLAMASSHYFDALPPNGTLLVVGGGTGNFFEALSRQQPQYKVLFVDISGRMIALAQAHLRTLPEDSRPQVTFLRCSWDEIPPGVRADTVLTPFFLDCFRDPAQAAILQKLASHLVPGGTWLLADFHLPEQGIARLRGRWLLGWLYAGFNLLCGLGVSSLPDFAHHFTAAGFVRTASTSWRSGTVVSAQWQRAENGPGSR